MTACSVSYCCSPAFLQRELSNQIPALPLKIGTKLSMRRLFGFIGSLTKKLSRKARFCIFWVFPIHWRFNHPITFYRIKPLESTIGTITSKFRMILNTAVSSQCPFPNLHMCMKESKKINVGEDPTAISPIKRPFAFMPRRQFYRNHAAIKSNERMPD